MEHKIGKRGGDAAGTDVEGELDGSGTIGIKALRHHRDGAENQGLRETELEHSDQDEKEIDRERAGDPRQVYLEARRQNRNAQVAYKFGDVLAALVDATVDQRAQTSHDDQRDEQLRWDRELPPGAGGLGQGYGCAVCASHAYEHT